MNSYLHGSDELAVITVTKDGVPITVSGDVEFCALTHTFPPTAPQESDWVQAVAVDGKLGIEVPAAAGTYDLFYRVASNPETPIGEVAGTIRRLA